MMRLYLALLRLYPAAFRAEYGEEMYAMFRERLRRARPPAAAAIWAGAILDTLISAAAVHWDVLRQDLRYAARTIARAPGFALTVILVAGLGIGANTAVFTVADHVLIRPLPFPDSQRLAALWESKPGYTRMELSPPNFRDWKDSSRSFETIAAWRGLSANLVGQGEPERLEGAAVTADLFPMLGIDPALGRLFAAEDDRAGAPGTLVLSYGLWRANFGADPAVLGKTVLLDNTPYVVTGVMPREFRFPNRDVEIWTAMRFDADDFEDRGNNYLHVAAKLKPGVSLEQAREEMRVIAARLERAYPKENERTGATVNLMRDEISDRTRRLLSALFGASVCLLLITCTNLANLLLARALARRKELAVRTSLGAGRERLVRQLVTESLVLAAAGGVLGVLAANAALPLLASLAPGSMPAAEPSIDFRVLAFTALVTVLTGLGFGVLPALRACGGASADGLREGSRSVAGGHSPRLRSALVIAEVAISVVLLISAGLLIRALWRLQATDPGFTAEGVLTLRTSLPMPKYERATRREQYYSKVLSEIRALPGVSDAAYISFLPMVLRGGIWPVNIGGRTHNRAERHTASLRFVTPGFFAALRIPIRLGRDVSESDTRYSMNTAVVSESFVRRYWPGEDPLGRRFEFAFRERTIVGVVGDIRVRGLEQSSEPQVYLPHTQTPETGLTWYSPKDLVVRSSTALLPAIRRIIRSADPEQPISDVRTLADIVEADSAPRRAQARVLVAFAAAAILLAAIGIHALLSFTVSRRAQEIGVRIALGAQSRDILSLVARETALLTAAGVVLGLALGYSAGRAMGSLLVGVSPGDPPTFLAAAGLVLATAAFGSFRPARRAVRIDPIQVIRAE